MKLLLLLASLLIIAIPDIAHARILQVNKFEIIIDIYGRLLPISSPSSSSPGIINSAGRDTFDMIHRVKGREPPRKSPPSPNPSPSHHQSTRGSSAPRDVHDNVHNYNSIIKWRRISDEIRSPSPPINSAGRDEFDMTSSVCGRAGRIPPPPPPKRSPGIVPLGMRRTPPALICMPGRPCTDGFVMSSQFKFTDLNNLAN